ncbi:MAG TPA: hypothetical protein VGB74_09200 [Actinoplanes sp.]|jgi:hypothetical protein
MTIAANRSEHLQEQPDWDCRVCHQPWPCANAKSDLLAEFGLFPSVLTIYLSAKMYEAASDLTSHGQPVPMDLYERFLSWVRRTNARPRTNEGRHYTVTRNKSRGSATG